MSDGVTSLSVTDSWPQLVFFIFSPEERESWYSGGGKAVQGVMGKDIHFENDGFPPLSSDTPLSEHAREVTIS